MMALSTRTAGSRGGALGNEVVVTFLDGEELPGAIQSFNSQLPTFFMVVKQPDGQEVSREIGFDSVKMISFLPDSAMPKSKVAFPSTARLVTVRFLDRKMIRGVAQSTAGARAGLYLVPTALKDVARIFVPVSAIRDVVSVKRLGEILTEKGMVTPEMVERAIEEQKQIRKDQIGQVLLKKKVISDEQLERGLEGQRQRPERRIGDILLEQGFVDRVQLDEALEAQKHQREKKLGEIMVDMGYATYKMIAIALAIQYYIPFMDLSSQAVDPQLRELVPVKIARRWQVMPVSVQQGVLTVAIADPAEQSALDELRKMLGLTVITVTSTPQDISRAINRFYGPQAV